MNYNFANFMIKIISKMQQRGLLIVFEGLDRSGKSTQTQMLLEKLQKENKEAEILRFPSKKHPFF